MKPTKKLGFATFVALTAMATIGISSATATSTQLCSTDTNPCKSAVTHVHETYPLLNIETSVGLIVCSGLFLSTSVGALGSPQILKGNFTYTLCKRNVSESCTVTEENGPAEIKVLRTGEEEARVTGEVEFRVKCGSFLNCVYNGEGLEGIARGLLFGGSGSLNEQELKKVSGLFCPSVAKLDIPSTEPLFATYISG